MKCENCGAEITDKMKFCSECGTRVPTDKECPACHTRCALAAKFCSECGHDFSKPEEIEEDTGDDDNDSEEDTSSSGHYSVILKDCGENKGAVLRDLVAMTGKRLWPDISDMVDNLPAVVAKGLTRDKADRYYGGLLLDGAQAEVVADGDGGGEDDSDTDEDEPEEEDSSSGESGRKSRTCVVTLKDAGSDKSAVIRELRTLMGKTYGDVRKLVEKTPAILHLDCFREKAEEIAAALEAVGATVEISDKDLGTVTSGNCSVVLKKLPFMMGRCDRAFVSAVIAEAMGCMPANAWKMMDDLPLTIAENISCEEAEEIASKIEARKCKVEIV